MKQLIFAILVSAVFSATAEEVVTNIYLTTKWTPIYTGCDLEEVELVSAKGMGGSMGGTPTMQPYYIKRTDTLLTAQFQSWDKPYWKGVLVEFKVEGRVLYVHADCARFVQAAQDVEHDLTVTYNPANLTTTPKGRDYGIQQLTFSVTPAQGIIVVGSPVEPGTPDREGWGRNYGLEVGTDYSFHAPDDGLNESGDMRWVCLGWTFEDVDGNKSSGTGREFNLTYRKKGTLTWRFDVEHKVAFTCEGGTVDTNKLWYAHGETVSVTCTPDASHGLFGWACEDEALADKLKLNPLSFVVRRPESITAMLVEPIVVRPGDDLVAAVANAPSHALVQLEDGVHDITSEILIDKPLILRSRNGAGRTVIRRVNVDSKLTTAAQRCLRMTDAQAMVLDVAITGGASYSDVYGSQVDANTGAGVYMTAGLLANCIVTNNFHLLSTTEGGGFGGGVAMLGDGVISGCTIAHNGNLETARQRRSYGGGVYMTAGTLVDSTVSDNVINSDVYQYGGGVQANGGRIIRCRIVRNKLVLGSNYQAAGAGLYANGVTEVSDTLIADNEAVMTGSAGGGVYAAKALTLRGCTIAGNTARSGGGVSAGANVTFVNSIVQGNVAITFGEAPDVTPRSGHVFANCLVTDSPQAIFADAANGDYALKSVASPGVDAGADEATSGEIDLAGNPRKVGPVDIGCFELQRAADAIAVEHAAGPAVVGAEWTFMAFAVPGTTDVEWSWRVDGSAWSAWSADSTNVVSFAASGSHAVELKGRIGGVEASATAVDRVFVSESDIIAAATEEGVLTALAQAGDGTTVHVPAGDYTFDRTIVIDKGVKLVGDAGADRTRFFRQTDKNAGAASQRCLTLNHAKAVVRGITFSGGCNYSPNYTDFLDENVGAGVWIARAGGTLDSCIVTNSYFAECRGGGLGLEGPGVVTNCLIVDSSCSASRFYGVGIYMSDGLVTHSTVLRSKGETSYMCYGGGVYMNGGALSHCRILDNEVRNGKNGELGGGVYLAKSTARMDNCLVAGNACNSNDGKGGGVAAVAGAEVVNCTIVGNEAKYGGGVYSSGAAVFANCIFQDNDATKDATTKEYQGAAATYDHCMSSVDLVGAANPGCIKGSTEFNDDYSLRAVSSAAVDKGNGEALDASVLTDLAGNPRRSGEIDIGAFEFQKAEVEFGFEVSRETKTTAATVTFTATVDTMLEGEIRYAWDFGDGWTDWSSDPVVTHSFAKPGQAAVALKVKIGDRVYESGSPTNLAVAPSDVYVVDPATHPDWEAVAPYDLPTKAATNLLAALEAADDGTTVHLAAGLYSVDAEVFVNKDVVVRSDDGRGAAIVRRSDKGTGTRVLTLDHAGARLEDLAITGGRIPEDQVNYDLHAGNCGGGIRIGANGGWVVGCVITNNSVDFCAYGGGIAVQGPGVVSNCLIAANHCGTARSVGRGVYLGKGATLVDSEVSGNDGNGSVWSVGAVYAVGAKVIRCTIRGNRDNSLTASWERSGGGGICTTSGATVENCLISDNTGFGVGGGIRADGADTFVNCTVVDNVNTQRGTVAAAYADGAATFVNCILLGGDDSTSGAKAAFTQCFTEGDAHFRHPASGDYRLRSGSPCVDAGVIQPGQRQATDLRGCPRVKGPTVDLGCYECQSGGMMIQIR